MLRIAAGLAYLLCVVGANWLTSHFGMVPVGFGLVATAGTYLAGLSFIVRDLVQDLDGRAKVMYLTCAGAGVSVALASPTLALASGLAFMLSELADMTVYTPLRRKGYVRAAVASNAVGAVVDTAVFLTVAGFPLAGFAGQLAGKGWLTLAAVLVVGIIRAVLRHRIH